MGSFYSWEMTLTHRDGDGDVRETLTLRDNELGDIFGEAMHAAVRWEGDDGEGPLSVLGYLVGNFTMNWCTFQDEHLNLIEQVLLQTMNAENCGELKEMCDIMERLAKERRERKE